MSGGDYQRRTADVYFDSAEELEELKQAAEASGCSISRYILEKIRKGLSPDQDHPRPDLSKELEEVKAENGDLKREVLQQATQIERYENELYKLRHAAFSQAGMDEGAREHDLMALLREGRTINAYDLQKLLGIDPGDSEAMRLVSNQLETLRRFGLVKETTGGWRWI